MKLAYLLNTYPVTSGTFIRREIEALERRGFDVARYAVRRWNETLVDARDVRERERTTYLLSGNAGGLVASFFQEAVANPRAVWRGFVQMLRLAKAARGLSIRHVAYLMQAVFLTRLAREDNVQHVHAHFATNATAVALLSRVMGGPSYSFTAHGPDEFDDAKTLAFDAKLAHAAFAIAISNYCKSQLIRFGGARHTEKIHIVHCGIDPGEFSVAPIDESEDETLVCVGRLCANKGQALLPEAVARLKGAYPKLKVILVGDGDGREDIETAIARHGVRAHVELVGWRSNDEVRALIRKSRALVLPTLAEGLPIVIMEALAMGRPVISTYIAGIPELLDSECGWIVPAGSVDELTGAMRAVLAASPSEIARLGAEGRRRVVEGFDIDLSAQALGAYFESSADSPTTESEPTSMVAAPAGR